MAINRARTQKNFNLYINGENLAGKVSKVKLPTVAEKVEEHRGAGMGMPIDLKMGLEPMEMTFTTTDIGVEQELITAIRDGQDQQFIFRSSASTDETPSDTIMTEVTVNGSIQKVEVGDFESGSKIDTDFTVKSVKFYEKKVDGQQVFLFDLFNHKWVVNGVDQWASERGDLLI
ncbi:phage major tail tube protein [Candidatus Albibeggiatoa sp. nov. NOAA]|uniref:phage major tail tube protein n=1 Tax=Candidatus Albibeggiatoa sp. nov. NOAA TaxID=3162724 RepID=UPI0032F71BD7|nr:phage major tail tube protein [Thiotrichaceae bacterium]